MQNKSVFAKRVYGSFNTHNTVHVRVCVAEASAELAAGKREAAAAATAAAVAAVAAAVDSEKTHAALIAAHERLEVLKGELCESKRQAQSALSAVHAKLEQTQHALMLAQQQPQHALMLARPQPQHALVPQPEPAMSRWAYIRDAILVMCVMAYVFVHM